MRLTVRDFRRGIRGPCPRTPRPVHRVMLPRLASASVFSRSSVRLPISRFIASAVSSSAVLPLFGGIGLHLREQFSRQRNVGLNSHGYLIITLRVPRAFPVR